MRVKTDNPWQTQPHHSGFVDITTHSLWASTSGPIRNHPNDPLFIFITGAGGPSASLVKVQEHLSTFIRVLFYDRAGYDRSTLPPPADAKIYASDTARDLTALLAATHLAPPYIVAAHSFGGIIARTFLEQHKTNPDVVVAMLLLDTATELMLQLYPRSPPLELVAIGKDVDLGELTHLQRDSGMSDEQWTYAGEALQRCGAAQKREDTHASARQLAQFRQLDRQTLGTRPLTVLHCNIAHDCQMLYDIGVEKGNGTEEERRVAREYIETFGLFQEQIAKAQCGLSASVEYLDLEQWGHDYPIRRPVAVGDMVRGLLRRLEGGKGERGKGGKGEREKGKLVEGA